MKRIDPSRARIDKALAAGPWVLVLAYGTLLLATAWIGDDAYITFRTVDNFLSGYGPVYNPGERVQSYTHPLWAMLVLALRPLFDTPYAATMSLSLGLSMATVVTLVRSRGIGPIGAMLGVAILSLSRAYMDFSTSGLENPLSHLLLLLFARRIDISRRDAVPTEPKATGTWLLVGLLMLNRMDTALLVAPWALQWLWRNRTRGLSCCVPPIIGLLPVVAWEAFSLIYYGFPFPNTYYAKLPGGIPRLDLMVRGLVYIGNSLQKDPLTPLTVVYAIWVARRLPDNSFKVLAGGMLLYLLYVIRIGGDFMSGRFLAAPLLFGVWILSRSFDRLPHPRVIPTVAVALGLLARPPTFVLAPYLDQEPAMEGRDIANERSHYYKHTGLFRFGEHFEKHPWVQSGKVARASDEEVRVAWTVGFEGYFAGSSVHVIDIFGLVDPLIARIPLHDGAYWRIGHFPRPIPAGYEDTLRTGQNHIEDADLAAYYDVLSKVIHDDVFSQDRMRAIVDLNTGTFDERLHGR